MSKSARDLKDLVEETKQAKRSKKAKVDPNLNRTRSQAQDVPPEVPGDEQPKASDESESESKFEKYKDMALPHLRNGAEKVTSFLGDTVISTAITTTLTIFGVYLLSKMGVGAILGLLAITGIGIGFKYTSNVIAGRGFNPLKNMPQAA